MNDLTFVLMLSALHIVGLVVLAALLAVAFGDARSESDEERRDQGGDPPDRPPDPSSGPPPLPDSGSGHSRVRRRHLPAPARRATHPVRRLSEVP